MSTDGFKINGIPIKFNKLLTSWCNLFVTIFIFSIISEADLKKKKEKKDLNTCFNYDRLDVRMVM